ncbi:MAG: hypothetical protein V4492_00120 [Chlamydiota bacterium]
MSINEMMNLASAPVENIQVATVGLVTSGVQASAVVVDAENDVLQFWQNLQTDASKIYNEQETALQSKITALSAKKQTGNVPAELNNYMTQYSTVTTSQQNFSTLVNVPVQQVTTEATSLQSALAKAFDQWSQPAQQQESQMTTNIANAASA